MSDPDSYFLEDDGDLLEHELTQQPRPRGSRLESSLRKPGTASGFKEQPCFVKFNRFVKFHRMPIRFFWR
jgi:hypothetical protein